MITEDYVSFEIAKLLKEKGFDEPCVYVYRHDGSEDIWDADKEVIAYQEPTLQMAMKWLREIHKVHIIIDYSVCFSKYSFDAIRLHSTNLTNIEDSFIYDTYEEVAEAAIKYCLENLIK